MEEEEEAWCAQFGAVWALVIHGGDGGGSMKHEE